MKSLRHRRAVSSRTPNASAIRPLVHPDSVSTMAHGQSASARSRDPLRSASARCSSSLALTGDLPPMIHPRSPTNAGNHIPIPLARPHSFA